MKRSLLLPWIAVLLPIIGAIPASAQSGKMVSAASIPKFRSAAAARSFGEAQQSARRYDLASSAFLQEAALRGRMGDPQGGEVERRRALRLGTSIVLGIQSPPILQQRLAKWEPKAGCYVGVLDTPGEAHSFPGESDAADFAQRIGKPLALVYQYARYGSPFPERWARRSVDQGCAIQIAWEPDEIRAVRDDNYLENYARDASALGAPIFLRFGGEMNGAWTAWHSDPAAYRRAFCTVAAVMHREAPNVAMVWAPNDVPVDNLERYYPGDDAVDWVGISLYIVRYYDDRRSEPAWQDHPATFIEPFYSRYAARKPLCLAECGVTHASRVEGSADQGQFAAARIEDLLSALKVRFPRVKMFCWFDRNNLGGAQAGRRLNDYSLPSGTAELAAFRSGIADPYFLTRVSADASAPYGYQALRTAFPAGYSGVVAVSLRTYSLNPTLDVTRAGRSTSFGRPYSFAMPTGSGAMTVTVRDSSGRIAGSVKLDEKPSYGAQQGIR